MKQSKLIFFIVALSIFAFNESISQGVIDSVNYPDSVEKFDMIEIQFNIDSLWPSDYNYYDPDTCDVYGTFTNGTVSEQVIGFYYEGFDRTSATSQNSVPPWDTIEILDTTGVRGWRIRFTPELEGDWQFEITAINVIEGTTLTLGNLSFDCLPSNRRGFIGISESNNRYFEYSNGGYYEPIGHNIGWYYWDGAKKHNESFGDVTQPYGTYEYDYYISELADNGANYFRNWIGHYRSLSITPNYDYELDTFFYNRINQKDAWRLDYIVEESRNSNPRINIMPCFFTHQYFKTESTWNQQWEDTLNPYRDDTGLGTCGEPWEFFIDDSARIVTKNAIRYIVARWGYSTNILAWEPFNEVDKLIYNIPNTDYTNIYQIKDWHQEMYEYIKGLDDNHLISTSFASSDTSYPSVLSIADTMDFSQAHRYWDSNANQSHKFNIVSFGLASKFRAAFPNVPYLFGETDYLDVTVNNDSLDPLGYQIHCMNFASLFTGAVGATAYWRWHKAYRLTYSQHYQPVSEFTKNLELFHDSYTYIYDEPDIVNDMIHLTYMISDNNEFVAGWGQDDAFEFNTLLIDTNFSYLDTFLDSIPSNQPEHFENSDRTITINGLKQGIYELRWFNTNDGTEITEKTEFLNVNQSFIDITIPPEDYDTPYGDFAFVMDYEGFRKEPYLVFQNEPDTGQQGNYTSTLKDLVVRWQLYSEADTCTIHWGEDENCSTGSAIVDPIDEWNDFLYEYPFLLEDLDPQTQYYYIVRAQMNYLSEPLEFISSFVTPPDTNATDLSFFAYGDTRGGYGIPDTLAWSWDWYRSPYHEIVCEEINNQIDPELGSQSFILHAGDWNAEDTEVNWDSCYFSALDENSGLMKSQIPVMGAIGNHEDPGTIYRKYWPYSYDDISQDTEGFNYSFDYGPVHITCIEVMWEGISPIDENQLAWIENDFENTDKTWKTIIFHVPGYSNSENHNYDVRDHLQPLCEQYGIQLVIAGHNHYYSHWLVNGVHHLTLGGGGTQTGYGSISNDSIGELMVYKFNHFAKIDIRNDVMDIIINSRELVNDSWTWKDDFDTFTLPASLQICGGDETWDDDITYVDEIRVCDSSTLTIKSTVGFVEGGIAIVEPGGKLILDGGTLTSAGDSTWQGIEVWGNPSSSDIADQGQLFLRNDAIIENAEVAVRNHHYAEGLPNTHEGGYVNAQNSDFINNEIAVDFRDYSYDNASLFDDCEFSIDDNYFGGPSPVFVKLLDIDGPAFAHCDFINNTTTNYKGIGIDAAYATFYIGTGNDFLKLGYGIKAIGSAATLGSVIRDSRFTDNFRGVYISGIDRMEITDNNFKVAPSNASQSPGQNTYGVYLDRSTGYSIEENTFTSFDINNQGSAGLYIYNSGGDNNMVYLNIFDKLMYATVAYGQNRSTLSSKPKGLCYKCNTFTDNSMDIAVLSKEKDEGIKKDQGSNIAQPDAPAGNRFSWTGPEGKPTDINNEGALIIYHHHVAPTFWHLEPKHYTKSTVTLKPNLLAVWSEEGSCPQSSGGGGGGGKSGLQDEMTTSSLKADSVQNILDVLVDGGDTEATELNVETSYPPESYAVYNDLMGKSPYLSPGVVDAAIEKDQVLPNVMIRDVMVANPQSAKEDGLLEKLDERAESLPDYMLAQILQGRSLVGYMEELYSQKSYYGQKHTLAFNKLVKLYVQDSVLRPAAITDSLIVLFSGENNLSAKYRLAMLYFDKGAYSDGQSILNDIPNYFELDGAQNTEHDYFTDYYQIISSAAQSGEGLTEAEVTDLEIIELADVGLASTYSRNLLIAVDGMEYIEPVILPDLTKSASADAEYNELMKTLEEHHYLKVFPNPARDYVVIGYELEMEYDNAQIMVYDNKGVLQQTLQADNIKDQMVVDTKKLPAGIYIASLFVNGKEMESIKFTIVK